MAVKRSFNWLGSMRVDAPHLRLIESSVVGDFQTLSGTIMTGTRALVAWGFGLQSGWAVGTPAANLAVVVADGRLLHGTASEAGTIFTVPVGTSNEVLGPANPNFGTTVVGQFTASSTNYVSVDLVRSADTTTTDTVIFEATSGQEFSSVVPLGRTINYKLYISTSDFSTTPTRAPLAVVVTDSGNNISSVTDARQMFFRLGTGGVSPNPLATFSWSNRNEDTSTDKFAGGDRDLKSQYDWQRSVMSRLWELGGGEHWYAPSTDRTVKLVGLLPVFVQTGENWYWNSGASTLNWESLRFVFADSTSTNNVVQDGSFVMADGDIVYVDLNRAVDGATIVPAKVNKTGWSALAAPTRAGSRYILAYAVTVASNLVYTAGPVVPVNVPSPHATNVSFGAVKLYTSFVPDAANPVVPVMDHVYSAVGADPGNVVARGITRDLAGTLSLGGGANDTEVDVSRAGALTKILGTAQVSYKLTVLQNGTDGQLNLPQGAPTSTADGDVWSDSLGTLQHRVGSTNHPIAQETTLALSNVNASITQNSVRVRSVGSRFFVNGNLQATGAIPATTTLCTLPGFTSSPGSATQFPAAGSDGGGGGTAWTSPGSITAEDAVLASANILSLGSTNSLVGSNFGFDSLIPAGASITGITAYVKDKGSVANDVQRLGLNPWGVALKVSGVVKTQDTANLRLPTTLTWYQSTCSAWVGITRADLLDGVLTMEVGYTNTNAVNTRTASVDAFKIAVTYTYGPYSDTYYALIYYNSGGLTFSSVVAKISAAGNLSLTTQALALNDQLFLDPVNY